MSTDASLASLEDNYLYLERMNTLLRNTHFLENFSASFPLRENTLEEEKQPVDQNDLFVLLSKRLELQLNLQDTTSDHSEDLSQTI